MRAFCRLFAIVLALMFASEFANAQPVLRMKAFHRSPNSRVTSFDVPQKTRTPGRSHLLVQFPVNPTDEQFAALQDRGAMVLSYVPDFAFSISAGDDFSFGGLGLLWIGRLEPSEKISPELYDPLASDASVSVLAEFYTDVDPNDARAIALDTGLVIQENPDLSATHLLLSGAAAQIAVLSEWDEVSYIFPASVELVNGTPVRACASAMTAQGQVTQSIPLVGDGWDGPGRGAADLHYFFVHVTEKLPVDSAESEILRAFNEWAKYAKLTFTPADSAGSVRTISVLFASGAHGDPYPFDGRGGALAHTFYPFPVNPESIAGDMHLDNDESWRIGADVDLFSVALHEAGHALGLGHSDKPNDVMYPYYRKTVGLTQDDIAAVLQLYAAQDATPSPNPPPPPPPDPTPLALTLQIPASPTTASSVALSGTTSGGTGAVQVSWSTNTGSSGAAQGSANWSIAAVPLSLGDSVITITARDSNQNQANRSFTITRQSPPAPTPAPSPPPPSSPDTTSPTLSIMSPATTNVSTSSSSLIVSGTAHDNVGVAAVTWSTSNGDSGTASGTDNWTTPPIPVYVGATTVTIRAKDAAGNTSWRSVTVTRH